MIRGLSASSQNIKAAKADCSYWSQKGFTLIELMVVVAIIAILAAFAIPSYRRYMVTNAESEVKSRMQQLQVDLERWRASALSYKGFVPQKGTTTTGAAEFGYADSDKKILYVPLGSTSTNYRYKITLVGEDGNSLAGTTGTVISTGRSWKMLAEPNSSGVASSGYKFMLSSTGIKCRTLDTSITISSTDCGSNSKTW